MSTTSTTKPKPVILSGIQPSGRLHIGNYIGALRTWVRMQDDHTCLFPVVDLHAITVRQDPRMLRERCLEFAAQYLASGIDPNRSIVFIQSQVAAHAQLAWVLECVTYVGELGRMTQFKDKSRRNEDNVNAGLFTYPVLMAADILLYQTDFVPVGADQKQHLELARDIAQRFNTFYGPVFKVPEVLIPQVGARIMKLQDPEAKMSKSDEAEGNYVALLDPADVVTRKIKRAVTDSERDIAYDERRAGLANLLTIYATLTGRSVESIVLDYSGKGYGAFKADLADVVNAALEPVRQRYREIRRDESFLSATLAQGAAQASTLADETLRRVYEAVGFPRPTASYIA